MSLKGDATAAAFHKIDEKVVSSCLLHYKPVCITNFDKMRRKMLKEEVSWSF